jgi:hypothetical protein
VPTEQRFSATKASLRDKSIPESCHRAFLLPWSACGDRNFKPAYLTILATNMRLPLKVVWWSAVQSHPRKERHNDQALVWQW